ncbi:MAG: putative metal-binding motif-containing protein, partial [Deltaproteobacteria bacterium]|nr:putative metal-binding motif-containing protein [Deltaproteobacteria bacterium]
MRTLPFALLLALGACDDSQENDTGEGDSVPGEHQDRDEDGYDDRTDCDDQDPAVHPGATEYCNGHDDDCDGQTDEGDAADATTWYADADGDRYGDPANPLPACDPPEGYVANGTDCDDSDPDSHPLGNEVCDGADNDCDGSVDEDAVDAPTWYPDADGDGYGVPGTTLTGCTQPPGYAASADDCDDADADTHPGADEVCDGVDNDCDARTDDDPIDGAWYYADEDGDTFGNTLALEWACSGSANDWDCDDADASEPQVVDVSAAATRSDGTAAYPWTTIQEGIDGADQCVVVYPGTYHENIDFGGKGIRVTGVEGRDVTVISGESVDAAVVTFASGEGADAELTGFTLTNGGGHSELFEDSYTCGSASWTCYSFTTTWCGGGIYVDGATPTLRDLVLSENLLPEVSSWTSGIIYYYYEYSYGGGLCARDTTLTLERVDLVGNFADQGGGAWINEGASVTWTQSLVQANLATDGAAFEVDGGRLTLNNVLSAWNTASDTGGGALVVDGLLTEVNVTHGGDDADIGGGLYLHGTSTGSIMNTILWGAATGEGVYGDSTATFSGLYNDVYGNAGGEYSGVTNPTGTSGNLSWDPGFT